MAEELTFDFETSEEAGDDLSLDYPAELQASTLLGTHVKRDALISSMLQDRNALRLIMAPHGFGKTELAREYAQRLFPDTSVTWIDAASPDFLLALDRDENMIVRQGDVCASLVILDNIPWLHEERAHVLSRHVDAALYAGIEVIATTLPSCDVLSALQGRLSFHTRGRTARNRARVRSAAGDRAGWRQSRIRQEALDRCW